MKAGVACAIITALSCAACARVARLEQDQPRPDPQGRGVVSMEIDASPSPAWVYIQQRFIGTTPLVYQFHYDSTLKEVEIVAEPLPCHTAQLRQKLTLPLPPVPARVHFFMNNPPPLITHD